MRARLVAVLTVLSLIAVAAFAAPLLASTARSRTAQLVLVRTADLEHLAWLADAAVPVGERAAPSASVSTSVAVADAETALTEAVARHHDLYGEAVLVVDGRGRPLAAAGLGADPLAAAGVSAAVDAALRHQAPPAPSRLAPWTRDPFLLWRPVGTSTAVEGAVVLRADPSAAADDIGRTWAAVLLGAVLAAGAAAALALALARWLLRPVQALASGFADVTAGRRVEVLPGTGPPELRRLELSFVAMAAAVQEAAGRQRELVADVSHQIRNPLAALQLRIDALEGSVAPAALPVYEGAVREVERLTEVLDGTLAMGEAQASRTSAADPAARLEACDLRAVAADRVLAWQPAADRAGADLVLRSSGADELPVSVPEREVSQVLDVLIDNAVRYGGRTCTVVVDAEVDGAAGGAAGGGGTGGRWARAVVDDDGPGIPSADRSSAVQRYWRGAASRSVAGSGLGLAIAVRLLLTRGGDLVLGESPAGGLRAEARLPRADAGPRGAGATASRAAGEAVR